jgi:acyl-CoA dehydrogenase
MDRQHGDETASLLRDSAERLFASFTERDTGAIEGHWSRSIWSKIEEAGFPLAFVGEAAGGFGIAAAQAMTLVRVAAFHAAPVPLAETMLANRMLSEAGFPVAAGPATVVCAAPESFLLERSGRGWRIHGQAAGVPWARHADAIVVLADGGDRRVVVRLDRSAVTIEPYASLANLPADHVAVDSDIPDDNVRPAPAHWTHGTLKAAGAALRTAEIAGALARVLELTVAYANERVQFGKPIGKQQAIQQQLAVLAGQAAAGGAAADIAAAAFERLDVVAIAAAKVRAGEAASVAAPIAHQVHGAIGFTEEHRLHLFTRRLWAWRDEFGSERHWSRVVGQRAVAAGGGGLWPFVVAVGAGRAT